MRRRDFLKTVAKGGALGALAALGGFDPLRVARAGGAPIAFSPTDPLLPRAPHFPGRAKSVIYVHFEGSPSQHDLFDPKPALVKHDGQPCPEEYLKNERFAFIKGTPLLLKSPYAFAQHGQCGMWLSELLPELAKVVDDVAWIKSMTTDAFNHGPAQLLLQTGSQVVGRPSFGSWVTYALGSECRDLPGFVVMLSGGGQPSAGKSCWSAGFLPSVFQGVELRGAGAPVLFLENPPGVDVARRRRSLDAISDLNRMHQQEEGDPEIATRIAAYELSARMQAVAPEAMNVALEERATLERYGIDPSDPGKPGLAKNLLLARRLVERGVRFVQLYDRGWDSHGTGTTDDIVISLPRKCREMDRPAAALIADMKERGLLESTLVVFSGEFGRTPMNERRNGSTHLGRDHNPHAFTMWMTGAGVKRGLVLGETDELGYYATEDVVHVHDLQATILHLLGFDHERLTYRWQGRDFRLTDVFGKVIEKVLA